MPFTAETWAVGDVTHRGRTFQRLRARQHQSGSGPTSRCRVRNSANISHLLGQLPGADVQPERIDVGAMHDTSSNTSRLTVPSGGGFYGIGGRIEFAANSTGRRGIQIRLNGTTVIAREETNNIGGSNDHPARSTPSTSCPPATTWS